MNWEAVGATGEVIGALAVVVTLAYLAIQVRQNTAAQKSGATQRAHDQTSAMYDMMASDSDLGEIFARGLNEPDSLNASETARFFALMFSIMFRVQNWYIQAQSGFIDKQLFESWMKIVQQLSGFPGFKRFWEQRRHVFAAEMVEHFENELFSETADPSFRPMGISVER